jgi:hypothetical protein
MWLYVPDLSTSSPSAPAEEDLTSASSWQSQALAQSVTWRGKHSPPRTWSQRCAANSWLMGLYGAMSEPSMAARGVALWTASLAASRASPIASPDASAAALMSEISGQTPDASSSKPARGSSSSRTSAACSRRGMTKSLAPSGFVETFESSVSRWREDCLRRQKLARRISASASSSSAWQTPISADSGEKATQASHQNSLAKQSGQWPTVTTSRGGDNTNSAAVKDRGNGNNLVGVVQQWPTPQARDGKGEPEDLRTENARPLNEVAKVWSTPSVADVTGGRMSRSGDRSNERLLNGQANDLSETWSTPRVSADRTSPTALDRQDSMSKLSIAQQAEMVMGEIPDEIYLVSEKTQRRLGFDPSLLPVQVTVKTGKPHSKERRSLNPLFVEWLMGWPPAWTLVAWTDFACSETELSRFKQRMRSALLSLGLPREAPAAQLSLWG